MGLTQLEVAAAGGPSNTTLTQIEKDGGTDPSTTTLKRLDVGLRWEPGSARRVYRDSGEPTPLGQSVAPDVQSESRPAWNTHRPEGMTDAEHEAIVRETREFYEWKIQQASRER